MNSISVKIHGASFKKIQAANTSKLIWEKLRKAWIIVLSVSFFIQIKYIDSTEKPQAMSMKCD